MSVKIRWNQASLFSKAKRLLSALGDVAGDDFLKKDLAIFTKIMLYRRIKSGKGVSSDKTPFSSTTHKRLTPLSKGYKRFRRTGIVEFKAKKYYGSIYEVVDVKINVGKPALGEFGTPDKSNLTFTGQLLASLTFDIQRFGFIILVPATQRRGSSVTNSQLAKWLSAKGRPFMNLTAGEIRIVKSRMKTQIQKRLRQLL